MIFVCSDRAKDATYEFWNVHKNEQTKADTQYCPWDTALYNINAILIKSNQNHIININTWYIINFKI